MQGEKLKIARLKAKLTQLELGNAAGCGERRITLVETGRSKLSIIEALRCAEVLSIDPGHLAPEHFGVFAEKPIGGVTKYVNGCRV